MFKLRVLCRPWQRVQESQRCVCHGLIDINITMGGDLALVVGALAPHRGARFLTAAAAAATRTMRLRRKDGRLRSHGRVAGRADGLAKRARIAHCGLHADQATPEVDVDLGVCIH